MSTLKAPFPYFGGKATVTAEVWARLGDVANYVEPFFGSGAVLLARRHAPRIETVNDADGNVSNFWRAVKLDPAAVARWIHYPVSERDLEARHYWLITEGRRRLDACMGDPDGHDAQVAGWWCWGMCSWIGSGWCFGEGPWRWDAKAKEWRDDARDAGMGINRKRPHLGNAGRGIKRQRPHLGNAGMGIKRQRPHLGDAGMGINRQRPHLGNAMGEDLIHPLAARLANVRICCGDWARVTGDSVTNRNGITGVFLDPPYSDAADRDNTLYAVDSGTVAVAAAAWAREAGKHPLMRIAFCGYEGEHAFPGWREHRWKAKGGYGSQGEEDGRGRANARREVVWFSPACLGGQMGLFEERRGS